MSVGKYNWDTNIWTGKATDLMGRVIKEEQQLIQIHPAFQCSGRNCFMHDPSEHHMRSWDTLWRMDKRIMERICSHGVGHPDPDDLAYHVAAGDFSAGIHSCDGCCTSENSSSDSSLISEETILYSDVVCEDCFGEGDVCGEVIDGIYLVNSNTQYILARPFSHRDQAFVVFDGPIIPDPDTEENDELYEVSETEEATAYWEASDAYIQGLMDFQKKLTEGRWLNSLAIIIDSARKSGYNENETTTHYDGAKTKLQMENWIYDRVGVVCQDYLSNRS